ncbi:MAG TPA: Lrp/AsnC family transcriptional regulator [Sphingomicrobium sp.]|nr:Lrp/AsnC family transcriptional regulator [Sphingomicrobium sp.]
MTAPLDDRDRQILMLLRRDAWLTYAALAERVNLSASAVQRRVERLIGRGVLLGAQARIADDRDEALTVYLLAELADDSAQTIKRFTSAISSAPEVRDAHYVTGEADVVLKLCVDDMAHYDRFVATHVNAEASVRRFKTLVALRPLT